MRFLLIILLITHALLACEGCDDGRIAPPPPNQEVPDASSDVQAAPLMVLHYSKDGAVIGQAFNQTVGSVPDMHGSQGPGSYLPFMAVLSPDAPFSEGRITVEIRTVFLKTGRVDDTVYRQQSLERAEDPAYTENLVYWGYVGLYPEEFDQSGTVKVSLEVALSDDSGNTVSDFCPTVWVKQGP